MIHLYHLQDRKIAVLGLSRTGEAVVAAALAGGAASVEVWDDNPDSLHATLAAFPAAQARSFAETGFDPDHHALVMSPGIPLTHPSPHPAVSRAKAQSIPVVGDVELLWQACGQTNPFIGLTGTNGKSTATALLGHVLSAAGLSPAVGGNIGEAVLALDPPPKGAPFVLELSSYQLDLCRSTGFASAALLNISPDHLSRHGGLSGYIDAKLRIFARQQPGNLALIGVDDDYGPTIAAALTNHSQATVLPVTTARTLDVGLSAAAGDLRLNGQAILDLRDLPHLSGAHNWQNAAVAAGLAWHAGLSLEAIAAGIAGFTGLAHRQERIGSRNGLTFVNDSKATNGEAAAVALRAHSNIYWLLGGQAKEDGLQAALHDLAQVRGAFCFGESGAEFAAALAEKGVQTAIFSDLEQAFGAALATAERESAHSATILLAPAAASWDQFPSFEVRGDAFRALAETYLT